MVVVARGAVTELRGSCIVGAVSGLDDEDYGPDDFFPVPHPDDRLWRHPAEVAAEMAAKAKLAAAKLEASAQQHDDVVAETPTVELPSIGELNPAGDTGDSGDTSSASPRSPLGSSSPSTGEPSSIGDGSCTDRGDSVDGLNSMGVRGSRRFPAMAAAVAIVGVATITFGALAYRSSTGSDVLAAASAQTSLPEPGAQTLGATTASSSLGTASDDSATSTSGGIQRISTTSETADASSTIAWSGPTLDPGRAIELHDELAPSMPRIQVATPAGMREGSGFFVSRDGYLVTSAGLVADSDYVLVWTANGGRWPAELVAVDPLSDVAVLVSLDAPAVPASFSLGSIAHAGDQALAIDHESKRMKPFHVASMVQANTSDPGAGGSTWRMQISPSLAPGAAIVDNAGLIIGLANDSTDPGNAAEARATEALATPAHTVQQVLNDLLPGLPGT